MPGSRAMAFTVPVISFTAASESTSQWDTSSERGWRYSSVPCRRAGR
jgi:hypothetical protein